MNQIDLLATTSPGVQDWMMSVGPVQGDAVVDLDVCNILYLVPAGIESIGRVDCGCDIPKLCYWSYIMICSCCDTGEDPEVLR